MVSCGNPLKTLLVAIVLVALVESGSASSEKLASCCQKVTRQEITDPILGYLMQTNSTRPCVKAIIIQTQKGLFCVYHRADWVFPKIRAFEKARRQATSAPSVAPSRVSLLSIITSTASPSSLPSSSSTSKTPVGEDMSDQNEQV